MHITEQAQLIALTYPVGEVVAQAFIVDCRLAADITL